MTGGLLQRELKELLEKLKEAAKVPDHAVRRVRMDCFGSIQQIPSVDTQHKLVFRGHTDSRFAVWIK